jgi:hypothetical protein
VLKGILRIATLGGLATLLLTCGTAKAQSTGRFKSTGLAGKIGLFAPAGKEVRTGAGHQIFAVEADYVAQYLPEQGVTNVLSIGYIEKGALRLIPMTLNQIFHKAESDIYYGYGLGLYSARLSNVENAGGSKLLIGGALTAGKNLNETTFIEAKYHIPFNYNSRDVGGLQLMYGKRF